MIVLYIILGLLLVLLLATLVPVRLKIRFQEAFALELRWFFFRVPLAPAEEGEEAREKPLKEKPEKEEKEKPEKPSVSDRLKRAFRREGLSGFLQAFGELLQLVGDFGKGTLRGLRLRTFDLYLCLPGKKDAAEGAIQYGKVSAGVYSACGWLFSLLPCKKKGVTVDLDYGREESQVDFAAVVAIRPFTVLKEGLRLLWRSRKPLKRLLR